MLTMDKGPAAAVTHTTIASSAGRPDGRGPRRAPWSASTSPATGIGLIRASFGSRRDAGFEAVRDQIGQYLAGDRQEFEVPAATSGDEYQERVWSLVRQIPVRRDRHLR